MKIREHKKKRKASFFDAIFGLENRFYFLLFVALFCQYLFWFFKSSNVNPTFIITPLPPSKTEMSILSFGDKEMLYRIYAFQLQNAGDTFGNTIPLKDYDFNKLEKWFYALSELDGKSEYVPSIAGFYYSASQNPEDNKHIVRYLVDFADKNPSKFWRWYITATYLARHKLKDEKLAFNISRKLLKVENDNIPAISRVLSLSFLTQKDFKSCRSLNIVKQLIKSGELEEILTDKFFSTKGGYYNFMFGLIKYRIDEIIKDKELLLKCRNQF